MIIGAIAAVAHQTGRLDETLGRQLLQAYTDIRRVSFYIAEPNSTVRLKQTRDDLCPSWGSTRRIDKTGRGQIAIHTLRICPMPSMLRGLGIWKARWNDRALQRRNNEMDGELLSRWQSVASPIESIC